LELEAAATSAIYFFSVSIFLDIDIVRINASRMGQYLGYRWPFGRFSGLSDLFAIRISAHDVLSDANDSALSEREEGT
jgi:hypothetical protein